MPRHSRRNTFSIDPPKPSPDPKPLQDATNTEVKPETPNATETSRKFKAYSRSSIQDKSVDQQRAESSGSPKIPSKTQFDVKLNEDKIAQSPILAYAMRGFRAGNQALLEAQPLRLHLDSLKTYKSPVTSFSAPTPTPTPAVSMSTPREQSSKTLRQSSITEFMSPVRKGKEATTTERRRNSLEEIDFTLPQKPEVSTSTPMCRRQSLITEFMSPAPNQKKVTTMQRRNSLGTDNYFTEGAETDESENEEDVLAGEPGILVKGAEELDSDIRKEEDEWDERLEKSFEKV